MFYGNSLCWQQGNCKKSSLFCDVTQRRKINFLEASVIATSLSCVASQKSEDLIYTAVRKHEITQW